MPKNLSFNADINLSGDITDVGDVTASSFIGTVAPATETTLTATSNTAFLTAASHTLANGSVQGTRKLIVNDQSVINPPSFSELADTSNNRNGVYSIVNGVAYDSDTNNVYVVGNVAGWRDLDGNISTGNIRRIAVYDVDTTTWATLLDTGSLAGVDNIAEDVLYYNGVLYIAGNFANLVDQNNANPVLSRGFAKYTVSTNTFDQTISEPFGNNDSQAVALTRLGTDLYVGGRMKLLGGGLGSKVLKMDTATDTFSIPSGSSSTDIYYNNGDVLALTNDGTNVYAGGEGSMRIGSSTVAYGVAVFRTESSTWTKLVDGVSGVQGISTGSSVFALAYYNNKLYVGGNFTQFSDGSSVNRLAVFDTSTSTWSAVPGNTLNNTVLALRIIDNKLYVGGEFTSPGNRFVIYDPSDDSWTVPSGYSLNRKVTSFDPNGYIGGEFFGTTGSGVVKYAGSTTISSTINGSFRKSDGTTPSSQTLSNLGSTLDIVWDGTYWTVV